MAEGDLSGTREFPERKAKGSYGSGFEPVEASSVGIRVMLNRGESEEQVREH